MKNIIILMAILISIGCSGEKRRVKLVSIHPSDKEHYEYAVYEDLKTHERKIIYNVYGNVGEEFVLEW